MEGMSDSEYEMDISDNESRYSPTSLLRNVSRMRVDDLASPLVTSPVSEEEIHEIEHFYRGLDIIDIVWFKLLKKTVNNVWLFPIYMHTEVEIDFDDNFIDAFVDFKDYYSRGVISKEQVKDKLESCGKDTITVMFVELQYLNYLHSNVLVVDNKRKVVEHYEPHGEYTFWETAYDQDFQIVLELQLSNTFKDIGYKYTRVHNVCHQTNFTNNQLIEEIGYCNVYSGWFALYRCQNMNYSLEKFTRLIDSIQRDRGAEYIARYAKEIMKHVNEIAKKYGVTWDHLDDLNDYLIEYKLFELEFV